MTICNLYRVIDFPGKLKLSTITDSGTGSIPLGMGDFIISQFVPAMITLVPFPKRLS
jgi:hypothetical protein